MSALAKESAMTLVLMRESIQHRDDAPGLRYIALFCAVGLMLSLLVASIFGGDSLAIPAG